MIYLYDEFILIHIYIHVYILVMLHGQCITDNYIFQLFSSVSGKTVASSTIVTLLKALQKFLFILKAAGFTIIYNKI